MTSMLEIAKMSTLAVILGVIHLCDAKPEVNRVSGVGPKMELSQESSCSDYRQHLSQYIQDGSFVRNKTYETVPYIRTSFKDGNTWVRVPLKIADINQDGNYDLTYLVDITSPGHEKTKIYWLHSIGDELAKRLISDQQKSEFYRPLMEHISATVEWDAKKDIVSGAHEIKISGSLDDAKKEGDIWRLDLVDIDKNIYLLVEGLKSNDVWLAKFEGEKFDQNVVCEFENLIN